MHPIVSVIMPLYNSSAYMEESINSALKQSFQEFELILVDDFSSDDSLARAFALAERDHRIKVLPLAENSGGGAARNAGIAAAKGRFIAFLDSDDCWEPEKLATQIALMEAKDAVFSYTDYSVVADNEKVVRTAIAPDRLSYKELLKDNVIGCSTVIYDSERLGKRYFPLLRRRQDFGLWLSILREGFFAYRCGPALTRYRLRPGSVSANKFKAAAFTWKVYRDLEKLPLPLTTYYFAHYVLASVRKRL